MLIHIYEDEFIKKKIDEFPSLDSLIALWNCKVGNEEENDDLKELKKVFLNIFNSCYRTLDMKFKYTNFDKTSDVYTKPYIKSAMESINFIFKMYKVYTHSIDSPAQEIRNIMKSNKKRRKNNR